MAITPRSLLRSPLVLFLALASLGALALGGAALLTLGCPTQRTTDCHRLRQAATPQPDLFGTLRHGPCGNLLAAYPASLERWEQGHWESLLVCLDRSGDSRNVVRVADRGLDYFPTAESLYNLKAFHEIELRRYDLAVQTLETGLAAVGTPSNGVLENNLAWAGLWDSSRVDLLRARELYESSLRRDPTSCEAIHTGLWVEYAIAANFPSAMREGASQNYGELRADYDRCTGNRLEYGSDETIVEVLGAGVLDHEMKRIDGTAHQARDRRGMPQSELVGAAFDEASERFRAVDLNGMCDRATPVRSAMRSCHMLLRHEAVLHAQPSFGAAR